MLGASSFALQQVKAFVKLTVNDGRKRRVNRVRRYKCNVHRTQLVAFRELIH